MAIHTLIPEIDDATRRQLEAEAGADRLEELAARLIASIEELQRNLDGDDE